MEGWGRWNHHWFSWCCSLWSTGEGLIRALTLESAKVIIDNTRHRRGLDKDMEVPNRVNIFIWRTLWGCLPVCERLLQKGIQCEPNCSCCASATEYEWRCFIGCDAAQEVWRETRDWGIMEQHVWNAQGYAELFFTLFGGDAIKNVGMAIYPQLLKLNNGLESLDNWLRMHCRPKHISLNTSSIMA
jgi:hypothetical protein